MRRRVVTVILLTGILLTGCNLNAPEAATPTPAPLLPRVAFITPTQGDRVLEDFDLQIDLVARDDDPAHGIARLEVYVNDAILLEATPEDEQPVPTFRVSTNWLTQGIGLNVLSAIAYRQDGTPSNEAIINLEVVARDSNGSTEQP